MSGTAQTKRPLLAVCGPTASGKTRLAVDLAKRFDGEVISADSMQLYQRMDIGTAKPTPEEMDGVPHHLLDMVPPTETFTLVDYLALARTAAQDISERGKLPILAGGTGLYITSFVDNIQFEEIQSDPALRERLEALLAQEGAQCLWNRLNACDPELAEGMHPNNTGRIIRALEVYELTGTPLSQLQKRSRTAPSPYEPCMLGLCFQDRQRLYDRINSRVDLMLEIGLLEEVRSLQKGALSKTAAQAIGYKELFSYLDGRESLEQSVELIKMQSRRYAKRQMTWLRRDCRIQWLEWESFEDYSDLLEHAEEIAQRFLTERGYRA